MSQKILLVEDEFFIAVRVEEILADAGYQVLGPVATVAEAKRILQQVRPDACVLDFHLRDGFADELAPHLEQLNVPFILSSSYEVETLTGEPLFHEATNVGKPAMEAVLLSELQQLLKS